MLCKRLFDFFIALFLLIIFWWLLLFLFCIAFFDTQSFGFYFQDRVGQYGKVFKIIKIKTIHSKKRTISNVGCFLRNSKLDELPQLINIVLGNMSFVGPRPDIIGYYDTIQGEARKILQLKPGLTSEAALKYANEEELLTQVADPKKYNDEVIFPDKVKLNLAYYYSRSFWGDIKIIFKTIKVILFN
jgi:lipopolysaccharide/colanic/teichoic acid biosynthesis glycosyltransferase